MKKHFFIAFLIGGSLLLSSCNKNETTEAEIKPALTGDGQIARGKYLVTIGGCNDCHSPKVMTDHGPQPDQSRLLSGHPADEPIPAMINTKEWLLANNGFTAFVGPWGMSFAANLTPDDTGIKNWKFQQFKTAIREGKYKGLPQSRPLLPPMPWEMYRNMTDEDLEAVFAYLKSLPPVKNNVPAPVAPDRLITLK